MKNPKSPIPTTVSGALSARGKARALGVDPRQLARESRRFGWNVSTMTVDEIREERRRCIRPRKHFPPLPPPLTPAARTRLARAAEARRQQELERIEREAVEAAARRLEAMTRRVAALPTRESELRAACAALKAARAAWFAGMTDAAMDLYVKASQAASEIELDVRDMRRERDALQHASHCAARETLTP